MSLTTRIRSFDMMSFLFTLTILLNLSYHALAKGNTDQCYTPNGVVSKGTGSSMNIPLHACAAGDDGFATCCAEGDQCSGSNRLCYNPGGNAVWRNFCTDPTWKSESCSPLCRGTTQWDSGPVQVTPCSDGMYCCGSNNTKCCDNHEGNYAFPSHPISASTKDTSSKKMNIPSIIGIAVGVIGIISLIVVAFLLIRIRKEKSLRPYKSRTQDSVYLQDQMAPNPEGYSLHSHPSTASRNYYPPAPLHQKPSVRSHYVAEKRAPDKRLPELPREVYEMGGEGVTRFEAPSNSIYKDDKKFSYT